jgi:hypothetical protein
MLCEEILQNENSEDGGSLSSLSKCIAWPSIALPQPSRRRSLKVLSYYIQGPITRKTMVDRLTSVRKKLRFGLER